MEYVAILMGIGLYFFGLKFLNRDKFTEDEKIINDEVLYLIDENIGLFKYAYGGIYIYNMKEKLTNRNSVIEKIEISKWHHIIMINDSFEYISYKTSTKFKKEHKKYIKRLKNFNEKIVDEYKGELAQEIIDNSGQNND